MSEQYTIEDRLHRLLEGCSEKSRAYYDVGYYIGFKDGLMTMLGADSSVQETVFETMAESVDECIDDAMCALRRIIIEKGE